MLADKRVNSTTRKEFRSVRYRTCRERGSLTADSDLSSKFRLKRNSYHDSTLAQTGPLNTSQMSITFNVGQISTEDSYLKTFHSMMNSANIKKNNQNPLWMQIQRIKMPALPQLNESQFHILDEIQKPISFIKEQIATNSKQLKKQKQDVEYIRIQLQMLSCKVTKQVQIIKQQGLNYIQMMKGAIRKNQINQQQSKLKIKKDIIDLKQSDQDFKKLIGVIHSQSEKMQLNIYDSKPFQLQQNQQYGENVYF